MFFLLLCFIIQFIIACVCLGVVSVNSQFEFLNAGWKKLSDATINETQEKFNCCGFNSFPSNEADRASCPRTANTTCVDAVRYSVAESLKISGIVALIFCFTNVSICFFNFVYTHLAGIKK